MWNLLKYGLARLIKIFCVQNAGITIPLIKLTIPIQKTGYQTLNLELIRRIYTSLSTIGQLTFDGSDWTCWTLEPSERRFQDCPISIPSGTYRVEIRYSEKHKRDVPGLVGVPGRSDVEIHVGNYPKDTLGCILPGMDHSVDFVGRSKEAFDYLFPIISEACAKGDVYINVVG